MTVYENGLKGTLVFRKILIAPLLFSDHLKKSSYRHSNHSNYLYGMHNMKSINSINYMKSYNSIYSIY
jgi:hypothetical protein